jgi:nucleoside phosphorylase
MTACRLLLLTAIVPEARALARAFHLDEKKLIAQGITDNEQLVLATVGIRATRLAAVLARLEKYPQTIIITGVAGALAQHLSIGDIVVDAAGACAGPPPLPAKPPLVVHAGRIHTSATLVSTPAQKAALHDATGALAVDMETQVVQDVARRHGISCQALRAISDTAREPLDPRLLTLVDDQGKPHINRVVSLLARHPNKLPALLRIKRATDLALRNLSTFLPYAIASGWPNNRHSVATSSPIPHTSSRISQVL